MKKHNLFAILGIFLMGTATSLFAEDQGWIEAGKNTYMMQCARCHGVTGKGDGQDAKRLPVVPRNLVDEEYKFKSTEYGTPPSDEDLLWVLNHGMAGSGMPSFANLTESAKKGLIAYIKSISNQWGEYEPVAIPEPDQRAQVSLKKGEEVFNTLQCALCHGSAGRANGTSAAGLSVKPANLTQGWQYKAGKRPIDIYRRLTAGIAGSGMPSYKDAVPDKDLWQLSNYVASLQLSTNWSNKIHVKETSEALPTSYSDAAWDKAERTDIVMSGNWPEYGKKVFSAVNAVSVQAIANEKEIAFRLFWNDPTQDDKSRADALLLAFKPKKLKRDSRDNLHTLYKSNSDELDLVKWQASQPNVVGQNVSNLLEASRAGWRAKGQYQAQAEYKDGLWQLVFKRPRNEHTNYIGLSAWDGGERETGLKRSASQWISLAYGEPKAHH